MTSRKLAVILTLILCGCEPKAEIKYAHRQMVELATPQEIIVYADGFTKSVFDCQNSTTVTVVREHATLIWER